VKLWRVHNGQEYDHYVENIVLAETAEQAIALGQNHIRIWDYGRTQGSYQAVVIFDDLSVAKAECPGV
jgi:hypothetical protein